MKPDNSPPVVPSRVPLDAVAANEPVAGETSEACASVGELLRVAREKAGLSPGDIASRLRMGFKQVRALEDSDFAALPKGTFLRGFVRNFAKEVGVAPDHALRLLEETCRDAVAISASTVVMPSQQNIRLAHPGGEAATPRARVLIAFAICILLVAIFWYWWEYVRPYRADFGRPKPIAEGKASSVPIALTALPANSSATDQAPAQAANVAPETAAPVDANTTVSFPRTEPLPPGVAANLSAELVTAPRPALAAGTGLLGFTFEGKSWVEVVDASGKTVLDKTFKSGDAEEVTGRAPFVVVIGNAQATRMAYNGKEFDLTPHTRASVARVNVK